MTETVMLPARRVLSPALILAVTLIAIAAMALGFGIRTWTDTSASPATPAPVVQAQPVAIPGVPAAPQTSQPITRIGRAN